MRAQAESQASAVATTSGGGNVLGQLDAYAAAVVAGSGNSIATKDVGRGATATAAVALPFLPFGGSGGGGGAVAIPTPTPPAQPGSPAPFELSASLAALQQWYHLQCIAQAGHVRTRDRNLARESICENHGLPLVHFSDQPDPFLPLNACNVPQNVLTSV